MIIKTPDYNVTMRSMAKQIVEQIDDRRAEGASDPLVSIQTDHLFRLCNYLLTLEKELENGTQ